ncbi:MAG TPA: toll/interleukin-1 receptor domain-containing protein [Anaerolineales bacterium]|nr:toll/interleukin-1 receptor domain-containing protein [Anaerolineales bacterium]
MNGNPRLHTFICHASQDKPAVRKLFGLLKNEEWIDPWLDEERILGGQKWDFEIRKAVQASDVVIVCLTRTSITKDGYVQKEIRLALDIADEKPEGTIYIIPLKLEKCTVPDRLGTWQWINYFSKDGHARLLDSLRARAFSLGIAAGN